MAKIVMICTQATDLGNGVPTGIWFEELSTPYYVFEAAGCEVDIATLGGGAVPYDPKSYSAGGENPESAERFMADAAAKAKLDNSLRLADLDFAQYDGIFFPGGHGAVVDLPQDAVLAQKLGAAFDAGVPIAAVCHGPGGLVRATRADGQPIVAGKRVNSFTNAEEAIAEATEAVPFLLEDKLQELGGVFEGGPDFAPYAVRDGHLVTGQNPASSEKTAQLLLDAVGERREAA